MENNQAEITGPDLTLLAKNILENNEFDLNKPVNEEKHFEPIPNGFYGFAIPIPDHFNWPIRKSVVETIDIDYEDVTIKKIA